ncbi:Holliday junction branch migration protein RuvA [Legionella nagasakiensis]|uniref:Holliday junction branch migration protein RuvA n=1 Tax=Legionella nagasakiensis TaxID=535290 RepID=UPI0010543089|nr:Holliday junction branch migration protein RuvA [Legionella nagasakiensis]
MIGWLQGKIIDKSQPGKFVVDVNGVGYDVETSLQTFVQLETQEDLVNLHIHTIVREDALLLYGFIHQEERALFRALIKVNGIGPKMAMTILSSITPKEFRQCIQQQNTQVLNRLPGIGKKTAERLVVEMKDMVQHFSQLTDLPEKEAISVHAQEEAIKALEALGYKSQEAAKAVKRIDDGEQSCEQLIRQALQLLASR